MDKNNNNKKERSVDEGKTDDCSAERRGQS
jgi:hypothetical protein